MDGKEYWATMKIKWPTHVLLLGWLAICFAADDTLSDVGQTLVHMFKRYLMNIQQIKMKELLQHDKDKKFIDIHNLRICRNKMDCGVLIQDFVLQLDKEGQMRMCNKGQVTNASPQQDLDVSPYCQYLNSHFDICSDQHFTSTIGCHLTCNKCNECDDDECKCHEHATGRYVDGRYECTCKTGFEGDGYICIDIDECAEKGLNKCPDLTDCKNVPGSYKCICKSGYSGDGLVCTDINECSLGTDTCHPQATCINTIGTYYCGCKIGFHGNKTHCIDVDECSKRKHACHSKAYCSNTVGSYTCTCLDGYTGNGVNCTDINECSLGLTTCHKKATCINSIGSYTCGCRNGFHRNNTHCIDVDECSERIHKCDANAVCHNTFGSYVCTCVEGFTGSGTYCTDADECQTNLHNCHPQWGTCQNTYSSFRCKCKEGFEGNGIACKDVKECQRGEHTCSKYAECNELPGSYECKCLYGFYGNGETCRGHMGYEFFLLFPSNEKLDSQSTLLKIIVTSHEKSNVTVANLLRGKITTSIHTGYKMPGIGVSHFLLDNDIRIDSFIREKKTIKVTSDKVMTVYGYVDGPLDSGLFLAIPAHRMSVGYIVPSISPIDNSDASNDTNQLAVVASRNDTDIRFHLRMGKDIIIYQGKVYKSGDVMKITLHEEDTFEIIQSHDLRGTLVKSNKPIGVFIGHISGYKMMNSNCSHVIKTVPSVNKWDKTYIVPGVYRGQRGQVRVLASESSTILINSNRITKRYDVRLADHVKEIQTSTLATVVQASSPVFVSQVIQASTGSRLSNWDVSTIPGVNDYLSEYNFLISKSRCKHTLAVIVEKWDLNNIRLNGKVIKHEELSIVNMSRREYMIFKLQNLAPGSYNLYHLNRKRKFGMIMYSY